MTLTPRERQTIIHSLRVAAKPFDADAVTCADHPGLKLTFEHQARDARALADKLEGK